MTVFTKRGVDIAAPFDAAGQARKVVNGEMQVWMAEVERGTTAAAVGMLLFPGWAGLEAQSGTYIGQPAQVVGPDSGTHTDPITSQTVDNEGFYRWSASGWERLGELPNEIIRASNTGAGTANDIQATAIPASYPKGPYQALISINFIAANTGPMTISLSGETPRDVVTNTGEVVPPNYVKQGMAALFMIDEGGNYRFFSYGDPEFILSEAEAAKAAAEAAQAAAEGAAETVVVGRYNTWAGVEAANVDVAVQSIQLTGRNAAGDGGDVILKREASPPAHNGYLLDNTGAVFAITKRTVRLSQFDAFPSTIDASLHTKIQNALAYLEAVGGGCLEIDKNDIYEVDGQVLLSGFNSHIQIENTAGGVIKAASGLAVPVMSFDSGMGPTPGSGRLTTHGLIVDNSEGFYGVGVQSCTGIELNYLDHVEMYDPQIIGGHDPITDPNLATSGGDAGVSSVACRSVIINNPRVSGQPDAAFYPNWNNSTTVDGYFEINGGYYYRNRFCLTAKRNLAQVVVNGGLAEENRAGFGTFEVGTGADVARNMIFDGLVVKKTLANVFVFRNQCRGGVRNCYVEDVGYLRDGTGNVGTNARVFYDTGATRLFFKNNKLSMRNWASVSEYAFSFSDNTYNAVLYTGGAHDISGNIYDNWARYANGGDQGAPSKHTDEKLRLTDPGNAFASNFHPDSRVDIINDSSPRKSVYFKETQYDDTLYGQYPPVTVDLSALGVLAAGAETTLQNETVTGLGANDTAIISRLTSNLSASPGIMISWRTVADGVQYRFFNATAAAFDFTGELIRISF